MTDLSATATASPPGPPRKVVTRIAPSPTGSMHIGTARTALFNLLYARHNGGEYLVRVEDTDRERSTAANVEVIFDGLRWLGLQVGTCTRVRSHLGCNEMGSSPPGMIAFSTVRLAAKRCSG